MTTAGSDHPTGQDTGQGDGYQHLHPLTPLLRGWLLVAAVAASVLRNFADELSTHGVLTTLAVLLPSAAAYGYCAWRFTRFRVGADSIRLETGLLVKRFRDVRLDRIQSVEITQSLIARATGLAALRLDLGGAHDGDEESVTSLSYLSLDRARTLRAELLARAAGIAPEAGEAPERPLTIVPPRRLAASIALSPGPWLALAAAVLLVTPALFTGTLAGFVAVTPALVGVWRTSFRRFASGYLFTVSESPDGLRIRGGLLDRAHHTVPHGRVQAIRLHSSPLWRWPDWVEVQVNVAGDARSTLLPVAPRAQAVMLVERLLPGVNLTDVQLLPPPGRARLLAPFRWRQLRCGHDDQVFVTRSGRLWQRTDIIPHNKVQSIQLVARPLPRLLGLADVHLDSTGGPVRIQARLRDAREACQLVAEQAERSRLGPEQTTPGA
ncbi:putative membrane protein [Parafrankia irregularis]|uniref:Putative membrane protein n=1 Tax=Parafrankia irregularis TaxID=795642 RepID=A0A0S4QQL4_9ACTN|nr:MULTISPECIES: PH domain-containing protein [Parafrankia]MBE3204495.1 PH domain-containing protein [Parafrankia sp. CH37]CUU57773.1 putative membrane protein [Parafrankia irregularis]